MAKDDYFVLVYKILNHLYESLKKGIGINWDELQPGTRKFPIGEEYWNYIWENLLDEGLITGAVKVPILGRGSTVKIAQDLRITPKGIEYLQENSMMKKAENGLLTAAELVSNVL